VEVLEVWEYAGLSEVLLVGDQEYLNAEGFRASQSQVLLYIYEVTHATV
jgi:hypothetical protein